MSHTVKMQIELKDHDALTSAVEMMKGKVLGMGSHRLYAGTHTGFGFTLPGWKYPLVSEAKGTLAYDDFGSRWGSPADIETLKAYYAIGAAKAAAEAQGWYCEIQADNTLLIYHPDGGTLTVSKAGQIDASGFTGPSCATATAPIAAALGQTIEDTQKPEYNLADQEVNTTD